MQPRTTPTSTHPDLTPPSGKPEGLSTQGYSMPCPVTSRISVGDKHTRLSGLLCLCTCMWASGQAVYRPESKISVALQQHYKHRAKAGGGQ